MTDRTKGVLLVVSGPSGVGKGTVISGLLDVHAEVRRSVSCTTRPRRPTQQDGQDYHFISVQEFERKVEAGEFLEWAVVHKDLRYGTPRAPVEAALAAGQDMILEIDYQGARSVREQMGERAVLVFIAPPSWDALLQRLQQRHTESPEAIAKRLASAQREIANLHMYEYVIINDELAEAVRALEAVLIAERHRGARTDWHRLQQDLLDQADHSQEHTDECI